MQCEWLVENIQDDKVIDYSDETDETENSSGDSEDEVPLLRCRSEYFIVKKKLPNGRQRLIYEWSKHPVPTNRRERIVTHLPGPRQNCKNVKTPEDSWTLFFSENLIEKIVLYTNKKIRSVAHNFDRERDRNETNVPEMKALIGR